MAKTKDEASTDATISTPAVVASPADSTESVNLDRTFTHQGTHYGPGSVKVAPALAADLRQAMERAQKRDAEIEGSKRAIDIREDARRKQAETDDVSAPK